ncbi:hypothetical protein D8B26_008224 [Coccidioides posadasii str. Silveira]|uniref:Uncharacterized protein n=3 Tax=Coccidioides posadasii TaxID=199306 RepID=E9DGK1_COCPS|nr:hypothetical protein CPC735_043440 [Coccidioides posadasii C735 delta SOWgp]EER25900.1 hypothetical protein CPC735_043440 [Coccidioides posadasii C735 delta SOWgp]EFW14362.1 conserved hypothetical protein [Coccidioides posadasii str. Silveira]KMM69617.1 hypothetical protein CPAG_05932 [Coccidioides posadasii RMSCC 3488]QVM13615.1 hypothetical protein D8B26_008224 [Coccidioides posadasii str. Silveira]|eukprot:XP_003068045.1 hypothetical protein CPC735_043440 [Coccidioides posadasii C735 delta SOWgp]
MKVAEILSDLTSLRACEHADAAALLNVGKTAPGSANPQDASSAVASSQSMNPDLQRAKDLIDLHKEVKLRHQRYQNGGLVDKDLRQARDDVSRVLWELEEV